MIVQCVIGPDPQTENIHMGRKLLVSRESSLFSFAGERRGDPTLNAYITALAIPEGLG